MRLVRAANEQPDVDWHNAITMAHAPWLMEDEDAPEPSFADAHSSDNKFRSDITSSSDRISNTHSFDNTAGSDITSSLDTLRDSEVLGSSRDGPDTRGPGCSPPAKIVRIRDNIRQGVREWGRDQFVCPNSQPPRSHPSPRSTRQSMPRWPSSLRAAMRWRRI
jgi:hypothetical protein